MGFHEILGVLFLGEDWIDGVLVKTIALQKKTMCLVFVRADGESDGND